MARNALEAVFGALGGSLVGYGRQKEREQERQDTLRRQALQDALTAADMLESGRWGTEAQLRAARGQTANTAGQLALAGLTQGRSVIPMPNDVQAAATQMKRPEPAAISVGGFDLRQLRTAEDERNAQNTQAMQMEAVRTQREREAADRRIAAEREAAEDQQAFQAQENARNRASTERVAGMRSGPGDRLTTAQARAFSQGAAQLDLIKQARQALVEYPNAVGLQRGLGMLPYMERVGDVFNQNVDPRGNLARQLIANIGSMEIRDRSGAAVTASEFPRLAPFIPNVYDTPEKVLQNLDGLERELRVTLSALANGASIKDIQSGRIVPAAALEDASGTSQDANVGRISPEEWTRQNPYNPSRETPDQYRARARAAIGGG